MFVLICLHIQVGGCLFWHALSVGLNAAAITILGLGCPTHPQSSVIPLSYTLTMPLDIDDDEYVARLLAQDAKKTSKTYELVGLDAFNPKRCVRSL